MTAVNLMSPLRSPGSYFPAAPFPPMAFSKASPGPSMFILASPFKPKCRLCSRFRRSGHDGAFGSRGCSTMQSLSALGSNSAHGDSGEPFHTEDSHKAGGKGVSKQTRRRGDSMSNRLRVDGLSGSRMAVGGGARAVGGRNLKHGDDSRSTSEETGWGRDSGFKGRRGGDFGGGFQRKGSYRDSRNSEKGSIANKRFRNVLDEDEDNEGVSPRSNGYDEIVNGRLMGSSKDLINDNNNYADGNTVPAADAPSDEDPRDNAKKNDKCTGPSVSPLGGGESYLSESRFDHCSISPLSLKGIKAAGYEKMTVVQEATLPFILEGKDVLAKAKTGTGKTVAFLLPSIEAILKMSSVDRGHKCPPITVLVVCPTRELANQVAKEADKLLRYHPAIGAQVVIGGTRIAQEQRSMQANPCQILIATPGRLKDHLVNTDGFGGRLKGVKVLILDEADQLLDMGFRKAIEEIMASVPKHRQTLLFSATLPSEVRQISHIALKRDHELIDTVPEGAEETHSQVKQTHLVAPLDMQFSIVYALLKEHISDDADYKVLVFCTTAMVTRHVADYLGKLRLNVREIHSRKSQSHRTRISDEFRKSKGLILVTSDVSARGVDYPDVTLVIQIGLPADREQYIHRLGRTGRKGKEGKGILLLAPWENFFLHTIKDLPMMPATEPRVDPETVKQVEVALSQVDDRNKVAAYQAWLGYYNSHKRVGRDKHMVVELANDFGRCLGFVKPPAIPKLVVHKMGLKNIPGLLTK